MAGPRVIDTGITQDTKIIANKYNPDDDTLPILQRGSLDAFRRYFERIENPDKYVEDPTAPIKKMEKDTSYSINSVRFVVRFMICILILAVVWDYLIIK